MLCVPVNHDSVAVSQHGQFQDPETDAAKWYSAVIHLLRPVVTYFRFKLVSVTHLNLVGCVALWVIILAPES